MRLLLFIVLVLHPHSNECSSVGCRFCKGSKKMILSPSTNTCVYVWIFFVCVSVWVVYRTRFYTLLITLFYNKIQLIFSSILLDDIIYLYLSPVSGWRNDIILQDEWQDRPHYSYLSALLIFLVFVHETLKRLYYPLSNRSIGKTDLVPRCYAPVHPLR